MAAEQHPLMPVRFNQSTEYEDLEQEARVVSRCSIYDPKIYQTTGSWLTKDELREIIKQAYAASKEVKAMKGVTSRVKGPLTKPFGQTAVGGWEDVVYPEAGPPSYRYWKSSHLEDEHLVRHPSSALDSLITMFRFLDFTPFSPDASVAAHIEQQTGKSDSALTRAFLHLMGLWWENQTPEQMVRNKEPFLQLYESTFGGKELDLAELWKELIKGNCLPDQIEYELIASCSNCFVLASVPDSRARTSELYPLRDGMTLQQVFDHAFWFNGDQTRLDVQCGTCNRTIKDVTCFVTKPCPPRIIVNALQFKLSGDLKPESVSLRFCTTAQFADRLEFQWLATVAVKEQVSNSSFAGVGFFHKSHGKDKTIWQFDPRPTTGAGKPQLEHGKITEADDIGPEWRPVLVILEQKPAPGKWSESEYLARMKKRR